MLSLSVKQMVITIQKHTISAVCHNLFTFVSACNSTSIYFEFETSVSV